MTKGKEKTDDQRHGRDEMNLSVLPIAKLGRADRRDMIEYYGTFTDGNGQKEMVWTVRGAAGLGLPGELGERVLVALLYIGAQENFKSRRMEFSMYQILKILGLSHSSGNYRGIERAIAQLHGITITSDNAWIQKKKDGSLSRARVTKGFHIMDDYTLWNMEDGEERKSQIVWSRRIWANIKAGYIKSLDIDFYYGLENPLSRRLYRFLDKMTNYRPSKPYVIDIFALANKLGMVPHEYPSYIKRLLKGAAQELVDTGWLSSFEFVKSGQYHRVRFCRAGVPEPLQMPLLDQGLDSNYTNDPDPWLDMLAEMTPTIAKKLKDTELVSIEDGKATIRGGKRTDWLNVQLSKSVARELNLSGHEIDEVVFVE